MLSKKIFATLLVCSFALTTTPALAEKLKLLASWGANNKVAYMPAVQFEKNLQAVKSDFTVEIFGPETVPPFEQMTPASAGVFDIIYTYAAYHSKALALATNAMKPDTEKMRSSGVFDYIDQYYQKNHNLKLLAIVPVGTHGYHCYLREPLSAEGDWKGRKIRGISTYVGVIEALGGVAVSTDMGEVYSGLDKGVIDGACAPINVMRATKHYEVAKYRVEPTFGQLASLIGMNLDRWNSLTAEQKKQMVEVGKMTEADTKRIGDESLVEDEKVMVAEGLKVVQLPKEKADLVHSVYADSVWKVVIDACGDSGKELLKLTEQAGLKM